VKNILCPSFLHGRDPCCLVGESVNARGCAALPRVRCATNPLRAANSLTQDHFEQEKNLPTLRECINKAATVGESWCCRPCVHNLAASQSLHQPEQQHSCWHAPGRIWRPVRGCVGAWVRAGGVVAVSNSGGKCVGCEGCGDGCWAGTRGQEAKRERVLVRRLCTCTCSGVGGMGHGAW